MRVGPGVGLKVVEDEGTSAHVLRCGPVSWGMQTVVDEQVYPSVQAGFMDSNALGLLMVSEDGGLVLECERVFQQA